MVHSGDLMDDVQETLNDLAARVEKLEKVVFPESGDRPVIRKESYEGLTGGIKMLIANGFFDQPKAIAEIIGELNREGYYNTHAGVASTLLITFVGKQKTLTRIQKSGKWAYVKRK